MQLDKSLSMLLLATASLSIACSTEAESFQHSIDASSTRSLRVDIEQGDLTLRGPGATSVVQDGDLITISGQSWGTASDVDKAAERRDGNDWQVDDSRRGELRIQASSAHPSAGVDFEVDSPRELRSEMALYDGTLTLVGTRGSHRIEASDLALDQVGGQLELYARSGSVHGSMLPENDDKITIFAEYGDVSLSLPRGLEYDLVIWADPEGTVTVDDLGLQARVDGQPGYFAGRSGGGRIEVEIIAPEGDVSIREAWIW